MKLYEAYELCNSAFFIVLFIIAVPVCFFNLLETSSKNGVKDRRTNIDELLHAYSISFDFGKIITILLCLIFSITILFANNQFIIMLGCDDLRAMPDGTYCYYVFATNQKDKTYTLPAKIYKESNTYRVENVYFKNGGYLYFSNSDFFEYGDNDLCYDQNDKSWNIELTTNKTAHQYITETKPFKPKKLIFNFALSVMFLLCAIYNVRHWIKSRKNIIDYL